MEFTVLCISSLLFTISRGQPNSLRFVDNNQTIPWTVENGNATFTFSTFPLQLALCMKINLQFARYISFKGFS